MLDLRYIVSKNEGVQLVAFNTKPSTGNQFVVVDIAVAHDSGFITASIFVKYGNKADFDSTLIRIGLQLSMKARLAIWHDYAEQHDINNTIKKSNIIQLHFFSLQVLQINPWDKLIVNILSKLIRVATLRSKNSSEFFHLALFTLLEPVFETKETLVRPKSSHKLRGIYQINSFSQDFRT